MTDRPIQPSWLPGMSKFPFLSFNPGPGQDLGSKAEGTASKAGLASLPRSTGNT